MVMFSHYLLPYLCIGFVVALVCDFSIKQMKTSKTFTFLEIWACILFWPIVIVGFIKGFLNDKDN